MSVGFIAPATAAVKMNIALDANGNISQSSDTNVGTKTFTMNGIATGVTLAQANTVFSNIIGNIANGSFDSLSGKKVVEYSVGEVE